VQVQDNLSSAIFMIVYISLIWIFLIILILKTKSSFKEKTGSWKWTFLAYFLLGFGDLFHLGFRIYIYFAGIGPDEPFTNITVPAGYIISGITMTYFYIAIFHAWSSLYGEKYSTPSKIKTYRIVLYLAFILRLILIALPYNRWYEGDATLDFGFDFRIITAIPIYIIGIISVLLLFNSSKAEKKDPTGIDSKINKGNFNAAIWFIVSYVSYSITLFLVALFPLTGMFMIPKTIAYLIAFFYHYRTMLNR
jgi:hypothetical protein